MSSARRPKRSASGPETSVKMPKNTQPKMSISRNCVRSIPSPGAAPDASAVP
jgi:hypothetical protein